MRHSAVWNENLVAVFAALQLHAIPIWRDGNEVIDLDLKASLLALEDDAPVCYVQYAAVRFVLYIVCDVGCPASVGVPDILEKDTGIADAMAPPDVPLPNNPFFIKCLVDVVALFAAFQKDAVCVQYRQAASHDFVYCRSRKYGLHRWHFRFE